MKVASLSSDFGAIRMDGDVGQVRSSKDGLLPGQTASPIPLTFTLTPSRPLGEPTGYVPRQCLPLEFVRLSLSLVAH